MNEKKDKLTLTLKKLIKATEDKKIFTSEEFLKQLIAEIHTNKILTIKKVTNELDT